MLRVGPRSAGAVPGPACYGRGGTRPTLTDAQVIAGRIPSGKELAGGLVMDAGAARAAYAPLAAQLGLSVEAAAESVIRIAVAHVVAAVRLVSTERGRDPRDHVLVPFGGAGPLLAAAVAEELGMARVLVPPGAGVLSAYGLLAADHSLLAARTRRRTIAPGAAAEAMDAIAALRAELEARFDAHGVTGTRRLEVSLDMRLVGQAFEIAVPLPAESFDEAALLAAFNAAHERIYRMAVDARRAVEIVSYRVGLHVTRAELPGLGGPPRLAGPAQGPLLIEDSTASLWVPPGWRAEEDAAGNLLLTRDA